MSLSQENRQIDRNNELIEYTEYQARLRLAEISFKSRYLRKMNLGEI